MTEQEEYVVTARHWIEVERAVKVRAKTRSAEL